MYSYLRECQYIFYGRNTDRYELFRLLYVFEVTILYPLWLSFYTLCSLSPHEYTENIADAALVMNTMLWASKIFVVVCELTPFKNFARGHVLITALEKFAIFSSIVNEIIVFVILTVSMTTFSGVDRVYMIITFVMHLVWYGLWIGRMFQVWYAVSLGAATHYHNLQQLHAMDSTQIEMNEDLLMEKSNV